MSHIWALSADVLHVAWIDAPERESVLSSEQGLYPLEIDRPVARVVASLIASTMLVD